MSHGPSARSAFAACSQEDVFLDVSAGAPAPAPGPAPAAPVPAAAAASASSPPVAASLTPEARSELLRRADDALKRGKLRAADDAWAEVIAADKDCGPALIGRARVSMDAGRPRRAAKLLQLAASRSPEGRSPVAQVLLGEALWRSGRFDDAVSVLDKAAAMLPLPGTAGAAGGASAATSRVSPFVRGIPGAAAVSRIDALAMAAGALLDQGNDAAAVQVLNSVLAHGEGHSAVLVQYARVTALKRDLDSSVGTLMRAVVADQKGKPVKEAFAEVIALPGAVRTLLALVPGRDAGAASALGFLAMCARDCGAVGSAVQLLAHAVERDPGAPTYALNLVHCLEHLGAYQLAFEVARAFCRRNAGEVVGRRRKAGEAAAKVEALEEGEDGGTGDDDGAPRGTFLTLGEAADAVGGVVDIFSFARAAGLPCPAADADPRGRAAPAARCLRGDGDPADLASAPPPTPAALGDWIEAATTSLAAAEHERATTLAGGDDGRPKHAGRVLPALPPTRLTRDQRVTVHGAAAAGLFKLRPPSAAEAAAAAGEAARLSGIAGEWRCDWVSGDSPFASVIRAGAVSPPASAGAASAGSGDEGEDGDWELDGGQEASDAIALLMSLVKLLHTAGAVAVLPPLVRLVERARRGVAMHRTLARNEAAYYCCVTQCLGTLQRGRHAGVGGRTTGTGPAGDGPAPLGRGLTLLAPGAAPGPGPDDAVVFVLGDSHSVTPAWHRLRLPAGLSPTGHDCEARLRPALVTGIKAWHLRPSSSFYPRVNWDAVCGALPDGATVLTVVGEIDCREGILVAVDKRRYKDVVSGVRRVVGILVDRMKELARDRGMTVLVQAAAPVLDFTRTIVLGFNEALGAAVGAASAELEEEGARGRLRWVDITPRVVSADGAATEFRVDDFGLDGTHMHPAYLDCVEEAIGAL